MSALDRPEGSIPPTPVQLALLRFIAGYQAAHGGVSPSLRECSIGMGIAGTSKSSVHRILTELEWRGLIRRLPHRERAIELLVSIPVPGTRDAPLYAVPQVWRQNPGDPRMHLVFDDRRLS